MFVSVLHLQMENCIIVEIEYTEPVEGMDHYEE